MKDKHMSVVLTAILAVVFIGGAVSHYSPDVCTQPHTPTTPPSEVSEPERLTQQ